jgi:putative peptidoglycan lipid II flippase
MVKKFLNLFNKEIIGLHEAAYLLAFFAFLSQLLALIRDKLLAHSFGASPILDLYYAAFRLPDLVFVSIASIVSASVLIPFFMEKMHGDEKEGQRFVDNIFSAFFFAIIVVSLIIFLLAPFLIRFLLPGYAHDYHFEELVMITRILLLSPIFLGVSNFLSSITQIHKRFLVYALSPLVYNVGIICGILFSFPSSVSPVLSGAL